MANDIEYLQLSVVCHLVSGNDDGMVVAKKVEGDFEFGQHGLVAQSIEVVKECVVVAAAVCGVECDVAVGRQLADTAALATNANILVGTAIKLIIYMHHYFIISSLLPQFLFICLLNSGLIAFFSLFMYSLQINI
jgi:hypothetical protein